MKYLTTIEQVKGWIGNEVDRLKKRLSENHTTQETNSLEGSILALTKLKDKLKVKQ